MILITNLILFGQNHLLINHKTEKFQVEKGLDFLKSKTNKKTPPLV